MLLKSFFLLSFMAYFSTELAGAASYQDAWSQEELKNLIRKGGNTELAGASFSASVIYDYAYGLDSGLFQKEIVALEKSSEQAEVKLYGSKPAGHLNQHKLTRSYYLQVLRKNSAANSEVKVTTPFKGLDYLAEAITKSEEAALLWMCRYGSWPGRHIVR